MLTDEIVCQHSVFSVVYVIFQQRKLWINECLLEQV